MKRNIFFLLFIILIIPCRGQNINDFRKIFDYDKGEEPDSRILSTKDTIQATCYNIIYSSASGLKVTACLIIPKQQIREFPVIIFLLGASQNRAACLSHALDLANMAFASLLIDAPSQRPGMYRFSVPNFSEPRKDFSLYRQLVLDVRRGIDFLEHHPRIDRNRIAFIGSGSEAMIGAIASGVEPRIQTYILMNPASSYSNELRLSTEPSILKARSSLSQEQINQYELTIKILNPSNYLPNHRNTFIFFQFSQNDPYYTEQTALDVFQITKEPKCQKKYKTTTVGLCIFDEAILDRKNWLKDHL